MPSRATCRLASLDQQIAAQRAAIARCEAALWDGGFNAALLPSYQSAWRRLEALIAQHGDDRRHRFVVVIPVADSPEQLRRCLASLIELCRAFGYGGVHDGYYRKISVMLADDSQAPEFIAAHRTLAREFEAQGVRVHYFGLAEQLALVDALADAADLADIIGAAPRDAYGHKGQARMRNLSYLELARQRGTTDESWLIYTVDADQQFKVNIEAAGSAVSALNFFAQLDAIFGATDAEVLTGKVVGDPPVSPAVMAGNFLDDVAGFLHEMAASNPADAYRQPTPHADRDAAYHDMAGLFGFAAPASAYRYRCTLPGAPSNAACFADFAERLQRFFHGEHPTRITWYRHADALSSVQPARTVYTGNYVFRPSALRWFIPFAPQRLRMSGPTLGRLLKAELGTRFVSANLPMLHTRTLDATGASEYRPGVVSQAEAVDLGDEFERQFYGDVMLFSIERLTAQGYPQQPLPNDSVAAALDAVHGELARQYQTRHREIGQQLAALRAQLDLSTHWWSAPTHAAALAQFHRFIDSMQHNFGADSPCPRFIASGERWPHWRQRLLAAITGLDADRRAWEHALAALRQPA